MNRITRFFEPVGDDREDVELDEGHDQDVGGSEPHDEWERWADEQVRRLESD